MDWNGHMTAGGWIFSILGMLAILLLVLAAVIWLVRDSNRDGGRGGRPDAPSMAARDILDRRLASGEIDVERYEYLRQTLAVQPERNAPESPPGATADASG